MIKYAALGLLAALTVAAIYGCEADDPDPNAACARLPAEDSDEGVLLLNARRLARFQLLYPCYLPNAQELRSASVTGAPGRQSAEYAYTGPFEMAVRQAQYPPAVSPDPAGASHVTIELAPNIPATLIERNDGSSRALYHLLWEQGGLFYEVQAVGPPQQRRLIVDVAKSLQPAGPSLAPTLVPSTATVTRTPAPPAPTPVAPTPAAGTPSAPLPPAPTPAVPTAASPTATVTR